MIDNTIITRKVEFDAGHRIPDHKSKCRNAHGHRYVLEASLAGLVIDKPGSSDNGMIADFGDFKALLMDAVGERWDHAFLVFSGDYEMTMALGMLQKDHKTIVLDRVPTVENLVQIAAGLIAHQMVSRGFPGVLHHVRLYETPNCWADWYADTSPKLATTVTVDVGVVGDFLNSPEGEKAITAVIQRELGRGKRTQ